MIDDILNALRDECAAFALSIADDTIGTPQVMLVSDFKTENMATYAMPLILLYIVDDPERSQYIGGATRVCWNIAFGSYHYSPDANLDDATGYPANLAIVIDKIADHFAAALVNNLWITQGIKDLFTNYCFQLDLDGVQRADPLNLDGLIMGFKVMFQSIALWNGTGSITKSTAVLQYIVQQPYP